MVETRCIVVPEGDSKQTWSMGTSGIFNSSVESNNSTQIEYDSQDHESYCQRRIDTRNLERRRQFVQEWFGDSADLNLVGTAIEKDLGNSRPKEMEKFQSQRHGQKMINSRMEFKTRPSESPSNHVCR